MPPLQRRAAEPTLQAAARPAGALLAQGRRPRGARPGGAEEDQAAALGAALPAGEQTAWPEEHPPLPGRTPVPCPAGRQCRARPDASAELHHVSRTYLALISQMLTRRKFSTRGNERLISRLYRCVIEDGYARARALALAPWGPRPSELARPLPNAGTTGSPSWSTRSWSGLTRTSRRSPARSMRSPAPTSPSWT